MDYKSKVLLFLFLIYIVYPSNVFPVEVKNTAEYWVDARGDDGDIVYDRISLHKTFDPLKIGLSIFGESEWNINTSTWEKLQLGLRAEKYPLKFLYIAQSIQLVSGDILDYMAFGAHSTSIDATTTLGLDMPLIRNTRLKIFEDYSSNLEEFEGEYCESGARIIYNANKYFSLNFGWQHTDRIHELDTDYVTIGTELQF